MTEAFDNNVYGLKKAISTWIISLQGTGDLELNKIVNELHSLESQIMHPIHDNSRIRGSVNNLLRQVRVVKEHQGDPYRTHLAEVEKRLRALSL
jgi:hypothetical protein